MFLPNHHLLVAGAAAKHTTAYAHAVAPSPLVSYCRLFGSTWWQPRYRLARGHHQLDAPRSSLLGTILSSLLGPLTYTLAALLHILGITRTPSMLASRLPRLGALLAHTHAPTTHTDAPILPLPVQQSLAFLLHNAPDCAGRWEHLVSEAMLSSLSNIQWQSRGNRNDVDIALCPARAPDRLHKVRGHGVIQAPASLVLSLVEGVHTVEAWEPAYRDGEVLRDVVDVHTNVRTQLLWSRHAAGPLVSDRDFVVQQTRVQLPCGTYVVHTVSTHDPEHNNNNNNNNNNDTNNGNGTIAPVGIPSNRRKGCVRAMLGDCGWVVRPIDDHSCHVTYVAQVDPKGNIPAWLVNKFATSMPMAIHRVRGAAERMAQEAHTRAAVVVSHPLTDLQHA